MTKNEAKKLGLKSYDDQDNQVSPNFIKIYANNVGLGATNWDMSLTFGEIVGVGDDGKPIIEQKVKVNMSREFVKALSNLLSMNMAAYEETFGELKLLAGEEIPELIETKSPPVAKKSSKKPR